MAGSVQVSQCINQRLTKTTSSLDKQRACERAEATAVQFLHQD